MKKSGSKSGFWGAAVRAVAGGILLASVLFFLSTSVSAQVFDTGTVKGAVTDPSGAMVPHAKVTVTNTGTGSDAEFTDGCERIVRGVSAALWRVRGGSEGNGIRGDEKRTDQVDGRRIVNVNLSLAVSATS